MDDHVATKTHGLDHRGLKPAAVLAAGRPHGDRLRYIAGCHCDACRAANAAYERLRISERKAGRSNHVVPADRARNWLKHLSAQGVGRQTVADCGDIARTIITEIMSGRRKNIRAMTERKILAVTPDMAADRAYIDATRTWLLIDELVAAGFTKLFLAQRLGYSRSLQFSAHAVTVRNAARVERLYSELIHSDEAMIPAGPSLRLIEQLREEGYTDKRIARELGDDHIVGATNKVSKSRARRIEETYRRLTT